MVSCKCDGVLPDDSGSAIAFIDFTTGVSYAVSIWFVFQRDAGNIYSNFIFILRFFVAMFYSVDWVAAGVRWVIEHNPVYLYIYIYVSVLCMGKTGMDVCEKRHYLGSRDVWNWNSGVQKI